MWQLFEGETDVSSSKYYIVLNVPGALGLYRRMRDIKRANNRFPKWRFYYDGYLLQGPGRKML